MKRAAYWAAPALVGLVLYWPGFTAWFEKDDFAWLGLYQMLHSWRDLGQVLFHPYAQGVIRTFSLRIPYTVFRALFGVHPLPFRLLAFATFAGVTLMLSKVCGELTGSRAAGFWAAILWTAAGAVGGAVVWSAAYYEPLCALVFLTGLWLLMRYAKTGATRLLVAQWAVFLFGFGVLEQNVVYPALAAAYALCCARHVLRQALPMFLASAVYAAAHLMAAPLQSSGPYRMHWDASVSGTLWMYWKIALGPVRLSYLGLPASKARSAAAALLAIAMLCFLIGQMARRRWVTGFFAAWFLITLAPMLPLRDHVNDYYLTIPLAGLAMWGASALVAGWRRGWAARAAVVLLAAIYLTVNMAISRATVAAIHRDSTRIHRVLGALVSRARARGAERILVRGVDRDLWGSAFVHRPLRLYGFDEVYLDPADRARMGEGAQGPEFDSCFARPEDLERWRADPRVLEVDVGTL